MKKLRSKSGRDELSLSTTSGMRYKSESIKKELRNDRLEWQRVTAASVRGMVERSTFFKANPSRELPFFDVKEIKTGQSLGEGEFGSVFEITKITDDSRQQLKSLMLNQIKAGSGASNVDFDGSDSFSPEDEDAAIEQAEENRFNIRERCWKEGKARYAVKHLKSSLDESKRFAAAVDLAAETKFLSSIVHPNIIRLRATAGTPGDPHFMLILDRLHILMLEKLEEWKRRVRGSKGLLGRVRDKQEYAELLIERIFAAYDTARALNYLHGHNILYRDLKPDNIGFDIRGDVRLFDFGIAKELKPNDLVNAPDEYNCTGLTGSRRWMAPEVCLSKPYGLKVDVYSFGLFFWQLCTLKQPFGEITADWHERWVVKRDTRPQIPSSLPPFVRDIIQACWSPKPSDRPSFKAICDRMPRDISLLQEVGVSMLHDRSQHLVNKSQHSAEVFMEKLKKGKD